MASGKNLPIRTIPETDQSKPLNIKPSSTRAIEIQTQNESDHELRAWLARNPTRPFPILNLPFNIILTIFSSLDIPDLSNLSSIGNQTLKDLATDSVLHRQRLRSVGPICLEPHLANRPNRLELAKTGKLKGLNISSKISRGCYLFSPSSIKLFENSTRINRLMISDRLNRALARRPIRCELRNLNLIDEEVIMNVSNLLAPIVRRLKRERAKDLLARKMRSNDVLSIENDQENNNGDDQDRSLIGETDENHNQNSRSWVNFQSAIQRNGNRHLWREDVNENVRLALCPGVKRSIDYFEELLGKF